jgi:hypothetical protein
LNGKGYVLCGQETTTGFRNTTWEYDPVTNSWSVKAPLPSFERYSPHGFALNGFGYLGGGNRGSANGPYISDMWKYDPVADTWIATTPVPGQARYGATGFMTSGHGYVHGGRLQDLSFANDMWQFDAITETWTSKPPMPGPGRSWTMVMPFQSEAVIACGASNGVLLVDAYSYLPSGDQWSSIPAYPGDSGWSGASFNLSSRVYGGLGRVYSPVDSYFSDWWELVKVSTTGVNEHSAQERIHLWPNPVASGSSITLLADNRPEDLSLSIIVYNALGAQVASSVQLNGKAFSTAGLPPGVYHVMIVSGTSEVGEARIVIQ